MNITVNLTLYYLPALSMVHRLLLICSFSSYFQCDLNVMLTTVNALVRTCVYLVSYLELILIVNINGYLYSEHYTWIQIDGDVLNDACQKQKGQLMN